MHNVHIIMQAFSNKNAGDIFRLQILAEKYDISKFDAF